MSADCIIEAFSGCRCPPGRCPSGPSPRRRSASPPWPIQALTCLAFGFLAAIASAAWMEPQLKHQDLSNQEQTSWK
ncbi:hypothetical protein [Rhizobium binae]|uniref:hypothetical protein n=1 Tax=Rhizobium binae TaxID=1138190 RepID=UPI001C8363F6|nr:hypothetical protein [Rhizobium binae]MBX4969635.1 hypothetical protein [Rhizobium binae]